MKSQLPALRLFVIATSLLLLSTSFFSPVQAHRLHDKLGLSVHEESAEASEASAQGGAAPHSVQLVCSQEFRAGLQTFFIHEVEFAVYYLCVCVCVCLFQGVLKFYTLERRWKEAH